MRVTSRTKSSVSESARNVPPYGGTNAAVRSRFWRWPDWNKDSLYLVSNTPLRGLQYLKGRAVYDRFYNEQDSYDDARYATREC